jgi:hypothetical protein
LGVHYHALSPNVKAHNSFPRKWLKFAFGIFHANSALSGSHRLHLKKFKTMTEPSALLSSSIRRKATELGVSEEIIACALHIIYQNKDLVNAIDNSVEMDDYIYRYVIRHFTSKRKQRAAADLYNADDETRLHAERDLSVVSREELASDPFYRAVLPLINKAIDEPVLRLHAEEASAIVLELADFKRRHRATSLTEVIVKNCSGEIALAGTH